MTQPVAALTYSEAMVVASAAYAAAQVRPELLDQLAATTDALATVVDGVHTTVVEAITTLWRTTNPYDDDQVTAFAEAAGRHLISAQRSVATATAAAQTAQLEALGARLRVSAQIPDDVRGARTETATDTDTEVDPVRAEPSAGERRARVRYDRPTSAARSRVHVEYAGGVERAVRVEDSRTTRVMVRAAKAYRYERSTGRVHVEATRVAETRIGSIVEGNLQLARALVETEALQQTVDLDREVIGYRRIVHPERSRGGVCGMCIVAADRIYRIAELKAIHAECKCTVLPVFSDYDPGHALNRKDLDALYDAAGSTGRDQLKRTRYKVEEHSELGPILVPVKPVKGGTAKPEPIRSAITAG
ncbi:hypothetical protein [Nocardia puris]|uniref:Uncharacterized protein n=1 Tax=Nocardia puris TaxID=208602 RepID=A0A366DC89_9NOCA|nr:hypothetical protein [Nocardia puris]RBO87034.1 hypothetical protein DFR74_112211 [Nocardia puris]